MDESTIRPYALQAGQGWTYRFAELGIDFVVKVGEQRHGRGLGFFELTTRAGEESPDHTHETEDEFFYVLQGEVSFRCGDDRFEVTDGGCVFLPRGIEHGYRIENDGDARLLVVTTPVPDGPCWGGFVGSFERASELRDVPPWESRLTGP